MAEARRELAQAEVILAAQREELVALKQEGSVAVRNRDMGLARRKHTAYQVLEQKFKAQQLIVQTLRATDTQSRRDDQLQKLQVSADLHRQYMKVATDEGAAESKLADLVERHNDIADDAAVALNNRSDVFAGSGPLGSDVTDQDLSDFFAPEAAAAVAPPAVASAAAIARKEAEERPPATDLVEESADGDMELIAALWGTPPLDRVAMPA